MSPNTHLFNAFYEDKEKLTQYAGHVVLDFIDVRYVYEIAKIKKELDIDFQRATLESICNVK